MKKTIQVTIVTQVDIEIVDELLTEQSMKEFSEGIFPVSEPLELFFHAAGQVVQYGQGFVEGLGKANWFCAAEPADIKFEDMPISVDYEEIK